MKNTEKINQLLADADAVIIGAGAGLSTAAGLDYGKERFEKYFPEFVGKYGMQDLYTSSFYPFETQEEKWAHWSRKIVINRFDFGETEVYKNLLDCVKDKNYFVITTNADGQFLINHFDENHYFEVQGNYGLMQCAKACHQKRYDNQALMMQMNAEQKDCKIPTDLVPKCPNCGGEMAINVRADQYFVEDELWHQQRKNYEQFIQQNQDKNIVFLEIGVGQNTPSIIKYPFWQMTHQFPKAHYICMNPQATTHPEIQEKSTLVQQDVKTVLEAWVQDKNLTFLIKFLESETPKRFRSEDKELLYRAYVNIRPPQPTSEAFLQAEKKYLTQRMASQIVDVSTIETADKMYHSPLKNADKIALWQGDITTLKIDGIVNAANNQLLGCFVPNHRCIDNAIQTFAGVELRQECNEYMRKKRQENPNYTEPTGSCMLTKAYNLPSKFVLHTVGPIVNGTVNEHDKKMLQSAYLSCLEMAEKHQILTLAFCCVSTGEFGFDPEIACKVAVRTVSAYLENQPNSFDKIVFNVFKDSDLQLYKRELGSFIKNQ